eukprot:TRINITY_DN32906_c0_g1_i1.p1 TRINITY_DN32906_c0_g1~~TRINITY_DN32906_c0_g1_i1.p1  ORF type:complete len:181 (-),score=29.39 TRINITY_DN32906_c0_g1_i1:25-489(-)
MVEAVEFLAQIEESGLSPDVVTFTTLINGYCKVGNMVEALKIWNVMLERNLKPSVAAYNALLYGYCALGRLGDALRLHDEMIQDVFPNLITYSTLVYGFCIASKLYEVNSVLAKMLAKGVKPDHIIRMTIVGAHCKAGNLDEARRIDKQMGGKM